MNLDKRIQVRSYIMQWIEHLCGHRINDQDRKDIELRLSKCMFRILERIVKSKHGAQFDCKYQIADYQPKREE